MLINATWGLGSAIAQGEVVPDRYVLTREGKRAASHGARPANTTRRLRARRTAAVPARVVLHAVPDPRAGHRTRPAAAQGRGCDGHAGRDRMGAGRRGIQAAAGAPAASASRRRYRTRSGCAIRASTASRPASAGARDARAWSTANASSPASRPATSDHAAWPVRRSRQILPRVAGVVAELGGSTSHLASLARERGIPMVLGVLDATHAHSRRRAGRRGRRGRRRALDALMATRASSSPSPWRRARIERLRAVAEVGLQSGSGRTSRPRTSMLAAVRATRHPVLPAARPGRRGRDRGQPELRADRLDEDHAFGHRRRRGDGAAHSRSP